MRLEPRIERLEAEQPDKETMVTTIILVGEGDPPGAPRSGWRFENGEWMTFEDNAPRTRR